MFGTMEGVFLLRQVGLADVALPQSWAARRTVIVFLLCSETKVEGRLSAYFEVSLFSLIKQ